jgi:hypothetical protein
MRRRRELSEVDHTGHTELDQLKVEHAKASR